MVICSMPYFEPCSTSDTACYVDSGYFWPCSSYRYGLLIVSDFTLAGKCLNRSSYRVVRNVLSSCFDCLSLSATVHKSTKRDSISFEIVTEVGCMFKSPPSMTGVLGISS